MVDFNQRLRNEMLRQAILQAAPDTTLSSVVTWLPGDFDLDEAELADMIATMATEPTPQQREAGALVASILGLDPAPIEFEGEPEPTPEALGEAEARAFNGHRERQRQPIPAPAEPPTLTFQEARDVVSEWANKLSKARGALMSAQARQQAGRLKLAAAIGQFVSGFPKKSREDLQREYLASEAERRQRVADGLEAPTGATRTAPTGFLTAMRAGQRGHSVNRGYGNNYVKKAADLVARQRAAGLNPGVSKVPSER
jgi:hypothetical protein